MRAARCWVVVSVLLLTSSAAAQRPRRDVPAARGETPRPYVDGQDAEPVLREALAESARDGRTVLVMLGANWCVWCRRLDYALRNDPVLAPVVARGFRLVHVDEGANQALNQRWGNPRRLGLPVLLVLGADGAPVTVQETGALELGPGHSRTRVLAFLRRARP
ncbi:MAG: thioredoxin family protein [Deltaproteobacteria bacterium]|nr:thioredoxin family protein [Deltaproteobacteria bacterium]